MPSHQPSVLACVSILKRIPSPGWSRAGKAAPSRKAARSRQLWLSALGGLGLPGAGRDRVRHQRLWAPLRPRSPVAAGLGAEMLLGAGGAAALSLAASMNVALYAGIAGGALAALILVGVLVYCCCCREKSAKEDARP